MNHGLLLIFVGGFFVAANQRKLYSQPRVLLKRIETAGQFTKPAKSEATNLISKRILDYSNGFENSDKSAKSSEEFRQNEQDGKYDVDPLTLGGNFCEELSNEISDSTNVDIWYTEI